MLCPVPLSAVVRGYVFYQCNRCKRLERGDRNFGIDVDLAGDFSNIGPNVRKATASNGYMPVGWRGDGVGWHLCPDCKE